MDSFIRYENSLLIEYNREYDYYWISYDSGTSYPYELYEYVSVDGEEYYIIYLEDKSEVPSTKSDVWISLSEVLGFISNYKSSSDVGVDKMTELYALLSSVIDKL